MLWVDQPSYYGADRRIAPSGFRLRERRRENLAGLPPALSRALRQLRMHVLDANGISGLGKFADRARAVALLAYEQGELDAADILNHVANTLTREREGDFRPFIYDQLDRIHGVVQTMH